MQKNSVFRRAWLDCCQLNLSLIISAVLPHFTGLQPHSMFWNCIAILSLLSAVGNPKVNYLSLDIEGAELQVLRSIPWHLVNIEVFIR